MLKVLVNTYDNFSKDIGIKLGISVCSNDIVDRGLFVHAEGTPTSRGGITVVDADEGYKYLGFQKTNGK